MDVSNSNSYADLQKLIFAMWLKQYFDLNENVLSQ